MEIAQVLAGFSLGQADNLRRAMGKKKKSELDKQYAGFQAGMLERGYSQKAITTLWEVLLPFSDYAFNKAHSAAYGVISYWTAYLKAHYPAEYMAALLTSVGDSKDKMAAYLKAHYPAEYMAALLTSVGDSRDKLALYLNECRRMGIKVLPPDVNESIGFFNAIGDDIRFGLGAVRNVGTAVVDAIVAAREEKGRFTNFHDFLRKVPIQVANKRTLESLIKSGAFDSLGATRRALVEIHEDAVDSAVGLKRNEANGQVDLFGGVFDFEEEPDRIPERPEWSKRDKLAFEREMLGLYVSDHPLAGLETHLAKLASSTITELLAGDVAGEGERVTVAGLITSVQHRVARNSGNQYGIVTVEDFGGEISVMFLGKTYMEFAPALVNDSVVAVTGRVSLRDDGMNLHAVSLSSPDIGPSLGSGPLIISVAESRATTAVIGELSNVLIRHAGPNEVRLKLLTATAARVFELPFTVTVSADLYGELKTLLGPNCLG